MEGMNIALVLSGGSGQRLGMEIPKQYLEVGGRKIISYSLKTLFFHEKIDAVQIVAEDVWQKDILEEMKRFQAPMEKWKGFSKPGRTRQQSIQNGLRDIKKFASGDSFVMVHDAARPLLSPALISKCFEAMTGYDGVMPVLPVKDTMYLKSEDGSRIEQLLNRDRLVAGQAPEVFVLAQYDRANQKLSPEELDWIKGSTEPAIRAGMNIAMVEGEEINFKITTIEDLERFRSIINESICFT